MPNITMLSETIVTASDSATSDMFGGSVALSADGTTMAVGVPLRDSNFIPNSGAVYIYSYSNDRWVEREILIADQPTVGDQFGISVALNNNGDTLVVGAWATNINGSVHIYRYTCGIWKLATTLTSDTAMGYGAAVSISADGNTLAVGSGCINDLCTGTVYIYSYVNGVWELASSLTAATKHPEDFYGRTLALTDDGLELVVGASWNDSHRVVRSGAVYTYVKTRNGWMLESILNASHEEPYAQFGSSVALDTTGHILIVGVQGHDSDNLVKNGAVCVYTKHDHTWAPELTIEPSDASSYSFFGRASALSADASVVAVGAWCRSNKSISGAGAVYIYNMQEVH